MKTATVRDVRQRFNEVVGWMTETGEEVAVTRRGVVVARLVPVAPAAAPARPVNWAARLKKHPPVGRGMSAEETARLWADLRD